MNIEKMRKEFEAWSANHDYFGGVEVDIAISGNYSDVDMQHAWEVWQASRAAIEVELPKQCDKDGHGCAVYSEEGPFFHCHDMIEAIKSLGLKVKS